MLLPYSNFCVLSLSFLFLIFVVSSPLISFLALFLSFASAALLIFYLYLVCLMAFPSPTSIIPRIYKYDLYYEITSLSLSFLEILMIKHKLHEHFLFLMGNLYKDFMYCMQSFSWVFGRRCTTTPSILRKVISFSFSFPLCCWTEET